LQELPLRFLSGKGLSKLCLCAHNVARLAEIYLSDHGWKDARIFERGGNQPPCPEADVSLVGAI
jgi:hypothetical protein